jgi:hypothetical protein
VCRCGNGSSSTAPSPSGSTWPGVRWAPGTHRAGPPGARLRRDHAGLDRLPSWWPIPGVFPPGSRPWPGATTPGPCGAGTGRPAARGRPGPGALRPWWPTWGTGASLVRRPLRDQRDSHLHPGLAMRTMVIVPGDAPRPPCRQPAGLAGRAAEGRRGGPRGARTHPAWPPAAEPPARTARLPGDQRTGTRAGRGGGNQAGSSAAGDVSRPPGSAPRRSTTAGTAQSGGLGATGPRPLGGGGPRSRAMWGSWAARVLGPGRPGALEARDGRCGTGRPLGQARSWGVASPSGALVGSDKVTCHRLRPTGWHGMVRREVRSGGGHGRFRRRGPQRGGGPRGAGSSAARRPGGP